MWRSSKWARPMTTVAVLIGLMLKRPTVTSQCEMGICIHRADNKCGISGRSWIWHPPRWQQGTQQHRGKRDVNPCSADAVRHKPSNGAKWPVGLGPSSDRLAHFALKVAKVHRPDLPKLDQEQADFGVPGQTPPSLGYWDRCSFIGYDHGKPKSSASWSSCSRLAPVPLWRLRRPRVGITDLGKLPIVVSKPYDPSADANAALDGALARARTSGKRVLIDLGGNWCPDCIILSNVMSSPGGRPVYRGALRSRHGGCGPVQQEPPDNSTLRNYTAS